MKRNILIGSLLVLGLAAVAPAQQVSFGIGPGGVRLHVGIGFGPRTSCPPPVYRGHREVRRERVWVEGYSRVVHVPARYEWRRDRCGRMVQVCVRPAHDRVVREPGRWEWRERRGRVSRRY